MGFRQFLIRVFFGEREQKIYAVNLAAEFSHLIGR